ncbi:AsmA family protein, partial [Sphingomonas zeae]
MDQAPAADNPAIPSAARPGWRRWAIRIAIGLLTVIAAIWLVLFVTKGRFLRHPFESIVGKLTHRTVTVGGDFQLYFAPWRIKFVAEKIAVSNPGWATRPNLFTADRVDSRIAPLSLLFGKRRFTWLELTNGAVDLEWTPDHRTNTWTFSDKKGGKRLEFPRIDVAVVKGTTVRYRDPRMRVTADLALADFQSQDARIGRAVGVRGKGVIRETPFTLTAQLLSPDATANRGKNELVARMRAAGNIVDVTGTLPSIADVENVPLRTRARGKDLSTLLEVIGVVIPRTRTYDLHAQLVKDGDVYRFTKMKGTFGDSDLAGKLTVTHGERLHLDST